LKATLSLPKKLMLVGATTVGILSLTVTNAFASLYTYSFGGDTISPHCHAWVVSDGSSWNWAAGIVEGDSNCEVRLEERNITKSGTVFTAWQYGWSGDEYHNDGVHQVRVWLYDGTAGGAPGYGAWVN